jgi:phosphoesterase RecJ-like protein
MNDANILEAIKSAGSIAIASHIMPDGDSVGSMLALYNALKRMGKKVDVFAGDNIPAIYSFLPNFQSIARYNTNYQENYELFIVLDCGSLDRTGDCSAIGGRAARVVNIDHHITNDFFGSLNLVDTGVSSTGELIYSIIENLGISITRQEAICLYTAILTDTGGFRHSNTSPHTHYLAGELIKYNIDFSMIYNSVYRNYKYKEIRILGKVMSSIELFSDGRIAYMQLLQEDLGGLDLESLNTSDFIDYGRDIDAVEAAVFVKEMNDQTFKLSLRSKKTVDVRKISEKYGGGGHIRAAGCTIHGALDKVKGRILADLQDALRDDME